MAFLPNQKLPAAQLNASLDAKANQSALVSVAATAGSAAAGVDAINNGTATPAGALTGADIATISRGAGALRTTLTTIGQWVLQTFQGFTQSGVGAVARPVQAKILGLAMDVTDFGADPTGVNDSAAAINTAWAAAAAAGVNLRWPDGTYLLNNTVTGTPVLHIAGRAKVIFNNFAGKNGFTFQPATVVGVTGGLIGFELIAQGQNGLTAVEMPKQSDQYSTYQTKWIFRNIFCHGANRNLSAYSFAWDFGFAKWFRLSDCVGLDFENVTIQGTFDIQLDPSAQFQDAGVELDAANTLLTARLNNLNIGPIYTAVRWGDRSFFSISHSDLIGTFRGIYQTGTTMFNEPKIHHSNINAQDAGIYLNGPGSIDIDSVTIRRHSAGWKGGSAVWDGLRLQNSTDLKVRACTIQPDESAGVFTGTMTAANLQACSLVSLDGNYVGVGNDNGVTLDNCTGIVVANTISGQNAGANVLFNLINNTRIATIGNYELVSSFAGTVLSKDGTIVDAIQMFNKSFDLEGTANINLDITRVNAATDTKKWRDVVSTTQRNKQTVSDAGVSTNYELVSRSGTTITSIEWRGTLLYLNGTNAQIKLSTSATPANNSDMVFQRTSDTQLTIKVKGSDGVVRSASLTLA